MTASQYFPISSEMFALACETVSRRVSRLPFLRSGVRVTGELIGVAMECLNAEFNKTLALRTPQNIIEKPPDGLDRCIEERLKIPGKTVVPVIVDVLCSAGIAETIEIMDRVSHRPRSGIRLLSPWTWHAASVMVPTVSLRGSGNDDESGLSSWMSMCPVCRTGILNRVVGKQLFGIPHTDFYNECTHCGAKFIPVGTQFRLVSIASVRDPLWRKNLNETFSAGTWSALARGTSPGGNQHLRKTERKTVSQSQKLSPMGLMQLKDGSLIVPFEERTLYFRPVKLNFSGSVRENVFSRIQKPLHELLENPAFSHLRPQVNARYSRYLSMKSGLFLGQLKERHDPFYREFLNSRGDEKYGNFRLEDSGEADKKGVLIIVVNKGIYHAVNCHDTFSVVINDVFGRVSAENCLLDGDETRCRVNALLCNNRSISEVSLYQCEKEEERQHITEILKGFISN